MTLPLSDTWILKCFSLILASQLCPPFSFPLLSPSSWPFETGCGCDQHLFLCPFVLLQCDEPLSSGNLVFFIHALVLDTPAPDCFWSLYCLTLVAVQGLPCPMIHLVCFSHMCDITLEFSIPGKVTHCLILDQDPLAFIFHYPVHLPHEKPVLESFF